MLKKIPMIGLYMLLAFAVALIPIACGSDDNGGKDGSSDMTGS